MSRKEEYLQVLLEENHNKTHGFMLHDIKNGINWGQDHPSKETISLILSANDGFGEEPINEPLEKRVEMIYDLFNQTRND